IILDKGYPKGELLEKIKQFLTDMRVRLGDEIYVGVGQATEYLHLRTSYEQAERACLIAKKEKRIIFEEELRLEMLQYSLNLETKKKFIERTIAPILADEVLVDTMCCWLENNMSINLTSEKLFIHKNTLYYLLQKI